MWYTILVKETFTKNGDFAMCGIVGFSGKIEYKREIVQNMMELIVHRGPNSAGAYTDADMALGFVQVQQLPHLAVQRRVDL